MKTPEEALILAGGLGMRLREVINDVPKPMAPVDRKPFLAHLIDYWIGQGIERIVFSTGYIGHIIEEYFGSRYQDVSIEYSHETIPLGTGGAVKQALNNVRWFGKHLLLLNGDTWFEADLNQLTKDASRHQKPVTVALKPLDSNNRYSGVTVDPNDRVCRFCVKGEGPCLINSGCYILDMPEVTICLRNYPDKFSLEEEFLVPMAAEGKIAASIQDKTFLDIGVPADYEKVAKIIGKGGRA